VSALDNAVEEIVLPAVALASHTALTNGAARNAATQLLQLLQLLQRALQLVQRLLQNDGIGAGGEEARGLAATQLLQLLQLLQRALQLVQRLLQLLLYVCCMLHHTDEAAENYKRL
jgi:predicted metal-dependent hydrolase